VRVVVADPAGKGLGKFVLVAASKVPVGTVVRVCTTDVAVVAVSEGGGCGVGDWVGELTAITGVWVGWAVRVWTIAVFKAASAVPALSTVGRLSGVGTTGENGRHAAVKSNKATAKTAFFIQPSSRL